MTDEQTQEALTLIDTITGPIDCMILRRTMYARHPEYKQIGGPDWHRFADLLDNRHRAKRLRIIGAGSDGMTQYART